MSPSPTSSEEEPFFVTNFNIYHPQRSRGKVIFSQASVIVLRGGGCCRGSAWSRGVPGGHTTPTATAAGGKHPTEMHSC